MSHRNNTYTHMLPDGNSVTAHMMLPCTHVVIARLNHAPHFSLVCWSMSEKAAQVSASYVRGAADVAVEAINNGQRPITSLTASFYLRSERARDVAECSGNSKITDFKPGSDERIARELPGEYTVDELRAILEDLQRVQCDYEAVRADFTTNGFVVLATPQLPLPNNMTLEQFADECDKDINP